MGYVDDHLLSGEKVVYRAHQHWIIFFWPVFIALVGAALLILLPETWIVGLAVMVLGALAFIWPFIRYQTSEYAVTNKRLVVKLGLIQREADETLLSKIENIAVDQDIPGRILGYGTITITGTGGTREGFPRISSPMEFRRQVHAQIVEMEDRRGGLNATVPDPGVPRVERDCPYCAEKILARARVCKHCGREVEPIEGGA
jgi:uncharacterized membrane protein YdbT with pleckstrin-like domain